MHKMKIRSRLWPYPGPGGWHFITLPTKQAKEIKASLRGMRRGWGSLPVKAIVGKTTWKTSIFPDRRSSSYVLPIKADVRKKEHIGEGDTVLLTLDVSA
jgi:hypothetical protein